MTTVYPADYDTQTTNSLGITKADKEPIVDPTYDIIAAEHTTHAGAIRQLELKLGDGSALLTRYGDPDLANVREIMDYNVHRSDRAGMQEHFTFNAWTTAMVDDVGAIGAYAQVADAIGVGSIVTAAGVATGFEQAYDHFHQRYSYFRARVRFAALPGTNGDTIAIGLRRDATHRVVFYGVRGPGAWAEWYARVENGGAVTTPMFTVAPVIDTWYTMEILTTATSSTFFLNRGTATEEYKYVTATLPENAYCHPSYLVTSNAGGETVYCDVIACRDTRAL